MVAAPQESHVADNQQQQQQQTPVNDWKAQKGNEVNGFGNGAVQDEATKNGNDEAQQGQNGYNDHGHVNGHGYDGAPHGMDAQAFNGTDPSGAPFYNDHFGYGGAPYYPVSDLPPGHRQIPCKFFLLGQCRNGDSCQWLHDPNAPQQQQQHHISGPGPNGYLPPPPMPYGAPQGGQFMYYGPPYPGHGQPTDANGNPQAPLTSTPGPGMPADQMTYFPPQFYYGGPPPHFQPGAPGHGFPPYAPPPNMANGMENGAGNGKEQQQQANGAPSPSTNQQPQLNGTTTEGAATSPNSHPNATTNGESTPAPSTSPELPRGPPAPQANGSSDITSPPPPMHLQPVPNGYMPYMPPFLPPHPEHFHPNMPPPPHMPHEAFIPPQADPTSPQGQGHLPLPAQPNSSRPQQAHDRSRSLGGSFGPPSFANGRSGPRTGPTPSPGRRNSTANGPQASAALPASSVKPYHRTRPYPYDLNLSRGERPPCAFFAVNMCRNGDMCGFAHPLEDGTDARSLGKGMCGVDGASEVDAAKNRKMQGLAFASGTVPLPYGARAPYNARNASISGRRGPYVATEAAGSKQVPGNGNGVGEEAASASAETAAAQAANGVENKPSSAAPAPAVANGLAGPASVPTSAAPSPEVASSGFQGRRVPTKPAAHVNGHGPSSSAHAANTSNATRKAPQGPGGKSAKGGKGAASQASAAPAPAPAPQRVPNGEADFPALQSALSPNLNRSNSSSSAGATFRSVSGKSAPELNADDGEGWSDGRGRDGAPAVDPVHKSGVITRTASFDGELEVVQNSSPSLANPPAPKISFASAAAKAANALQPVPKANASAQKKEAEESKDKEAKAEKDTKKGSKKTQAPASAVSKESAPIAVVEATA